MVQMKVSTIMKNSLKKAYEIASDAHKYQSDKGGKPYINHPITVSQMVKTKKAKIVALLHDVLEDSKYTKSDLEEFFTQDVCDAVQLLTRGKNENYFRQGSSNPPTATPLLKTPKSAKSANAAFLL